MTASPTRAAACRRLDRPAFLATCADPPLPPDFRCPPRTAEQSPFFSRREHCTPARRVPVRSAVAGRRRAVPVALAAVYYFLIAADQYVAEFRFALRAVEPVRAEIGGLFQGNVAPSPVGVDSYAVVQYLGSRDVIDELGKNARLARDVFTAGSRLAGSAAAAGIDRGAGQVLEKPGRRVLRHHQRDDRRSGPRLHARRRAATGAGDPRLGRAAWSTICRRGRGATPCAIRKGRCAAPNGGSRATLARLREFRDREGIIDPRKTADATQALAGRIRDEIVRTETELSTVKHYMRADAPSVRMLEARIQSLQSQLRSVESEVTDTEKSRSEVLSRVMGSYERLESERNFAEKAYQHALEALDRARMNADRQQVYIAGLCSAEPARGTALSAAAAQCRRRPTVCAARSG